MTMTKAVYKVQGMTCGHCASSVTEEIGALDGVQRVDVDVASGEVVVTSEAPLLVERVSDAVSAVGFQLVS